MENTVTVNDLAILSSKLLVLTVSVPFVFIGYIFPCQGFTIPWNFSFYYLKEQWRNVSVFTMNTGLGQ
jgi:hypothetical protein